MSCIKEIVVNKDYLVENTGRIDHCQLTLIVNLEMFVMRTDAWSGVMGWRCQGGGGVVSREPHP